VDGVCVCLHSWKRGTLSNRQTWSSTDCLGRHQPSWFTFNWRTSIAGKSIWSTERCAGKSWAGFSIAQNSCCTIVLHFQLRIGKPSIWAKLSIVDVKSDRGNGAVETVLFKYGGLTTLCERRHIEIRTNQSSCLGPIRCVNVTVWALIWILLCSTFLPGAWRVFFNESIWWNTYWS
jgi:hypothetical protein